ncbi:hypothetical protein AX774_g8109, partial [Zancudomyces culisetae]
MLGVLVLVCVAGVYGRYVYRSSHPQAEIKRISDDDLPRYVSKPSGTDQQFFTPEELDQQFPAVQYSEVMKNHILDLSEETQQRFYDSNSITPIQSPPQSSSQTTPQATPSSPHPHSHSHSHSLSLSLPGFLIDNPCSICNGRIYSLDY